jgi:inner membrane protein
MVAAACPVLPDLDVIGFEFGIRYADFWGHRGYTHSLLFAAILATIVAFAGFFRGTFGLGRGWLWLYFFVATASHGLLRCHDQRGARHGFFFALRQ